LGSDISDLANFPEWTPVYGLPSQLCIARFVAALKDLEIRASMCRSIANELTESLCRVGIECIKPLEGYESAGHFVSFRTPNSRARNELLTRLHARGLFIQKTWDVVPAHYRSFRETFPAGHDNSKHLAEHMAHIRVRLFADRRLRRQLIEEAAKVFEGRL
jgi:histidinol-phosphate/aromatic aminotransferase/cobyric acid decarboxylase-like protein